MTEKKLFTEREYETFTMICRATQPVLLKAMSKFLANRYEDIIETNQYIVAKGDIPVALVAHLDTVFKSPPVEIYYDKTACVIWSPDGLGADDRAGVYSILDIVSRGYKPTVILTTDEECGGVGARALVANMAKSPVELKYMIQLDRQGFEDSVFYNCDNPEFTDYVSTFGFQKDWGSFSDISVLCPAWGIAGVNLSVGYMYEHTEAEVLHTDVLFETIWKVCNMLDKIEEAKFYEYIPSKNKYNLASAESLIPYSYYEDDYGYDPSYGISLEEWRSYFDDSPSEDDYSIPSGNYCDCCSEFFGSFDDLVAVYYNETNEYVYLCPECYSKLEVHRCDYCGEEYISEKDYLTDEIMDICGRCEKELAI